MRRNVFVIGLGLMCGGIGALVATGLRQLFTACIGG